MEYSNIANNRKKTASFVLQLHHSIIPWFCPLFHNSNIPLFRLSVVLWQFFQLVVAEDRAVFADIEMSDIAAAAFPNTAFHSFFERREDPLVRKSKGREFREGELDHDRGTTDDGIGVFRRGRSFLQNIWHQANLSLPVPGTPI